MITGTRVHIPTARPLTQYRNATGQLYTFDGRRWRKGGIPAHLRAARTARRVLGHLAWAAHWAVVGLAAGVASIAVSALALWGLAAIVTQLH